MAHLVPDIRGVSLEDAIESVTQSHREVVASARGAVHALDQHESTWGAEAKRLSVTFSPDAEGLGLGKKRERFAEVVNMAATMERLLDALTWFRNHPDYRSLRVRECHPSTSDDSSGNDIVLESADGIVKVRCEVCDVVSRNAAQNSKEAKDIRNLGCETGVPSDGVSRYIATSPEFAQALSSPVRKWNQKPYRYKSIYAGADCDTKLLRLVSAEWAP